MLNWMWNSECQVKGYRRENLLRMITSGQHAGQKSLFRASLPFNSVVKIVCYHLGNISKFQSFLSQEFSLLHIMLSDEASFRSGHC